MYGVRRIRPARPLLLVLVIAALGAAGCNSKGVITGTVKYKGKLLKSGEVSFYGADKQVKGTAAISPEGTYTTGKIPVGEMTVCVQTFRPNPNAGRSKPPDSTARTEGTYTPPSAGADLYTKIDEKYAQPDSSEQKYTVKAGNQPYDIDLP